MQRNYLQEFNDGEILLADIPVEDCTEEIYLAAVHQNGVVLLRIPEGMRTSRICLAAVQQTALALYSVPKDMLTQKLCLAAVQQDAAALQFVPEDMLTQKLCLVALKKDGSVLLYIPEDKRTLDLCLAAVRQYAYALQSVPEDMRTHELYLAAVQQNGSVLRDVPEDKRTLELCMAAVQQDASALQYIAEDKRTPELCFMAVQQYGLMLQSFAEDMRTPELCIAAVQQDALALQYVPHAFLSQVIDKVTIQEMITNNYKAIQYIEDLSKYQEEIDSFLANVEYIIIGRPDEDCELQDIRKTYAHKRTGKTICLRSETLRDLENLLLRMEKINNTHSLHLVLVDHTNQVSTVMAGMEYIDVVDFCKNHSHIEQIELLGCNVAKASKPEDEKKMIQQFTEKMSIKKDLRYGFLSTSAAAINEVSFQSKCEVLCNKYKLDGVYILNKSNTDTYQLCNYKIANNVFKAQDIPNNRIHNIKKILENKNKPFPFPKEPGLELIIRGDNENPLAPKELKLLRALKYEEKRFEKVHEKYKKDKKIYPFLAKVNANIKDLQPSFLQKIVDSIERDKNITWDITVEGPTKSLHVDTARRDYKVTRTRLYPDKYKTSLFASQQHNINYEKLKDEQKKEIEAMRSGDVKGESKAKKIKVIVRGLNK